MLSIVPLSLKPKISRTPDTVNKTKSCIRPEGRWQPITIRKSACPGRRNGPPAFAEEARQDFGRVQYPSIPLYPADMTTCLPGPDVLPGVAGTFPCCFFIRVQLIRSGARPAPAVLLFWTVVEPCHRHIRLLMRRPYG